MRMYVLSPVPVLAETQPKEILYDTIWPRLKQMKDTVAVRGSHVGSSPFDGMTVTHTVILPLWSLLVFRHRCACFCAHISVSVCLGRMEMGGVGREETGHVLSQPGLSQAITPNCPLPLRPLFSLDVLAAGSSGTAIPSPYSRFVSRSVVGWSVGCFAG